LRGYRIWGTARDTEKDAEAEQTRKHIRISE
jgi:hypothetical protein